MALRAHLVVLILGCAAAAAAVSSESDSSSSEDFALRVCAARKYNESSIVCVCSAHYCDDAPSEPPGGLKRGHFLAIVSTRAGLRLDAREGVLDSSSSDSDSDSHSDSDSDDDCVRFRLYPSSRRQCVLGFGAAVTDSAASNAQLLSSAARTQLLRAYFGDNGARYTLVRVPMAGSDFSTREYSYDDNEGEPDPTLANFTLAQEDIRSKIPVLKEAQRAAGSRPLRLFTAPWGAPRWMVDWQADGLNSLKAEYRQAWADYFVKFLDAYTAQGLPFWALSPQNEPSDGSIVNYGINRLGWSPEAMRDWLRDYLSPTLSAHGHGDVSIMIHDDQRSHLPDWPARTLNDSKVRDAVSGVAVHWYEDRTSDPDLLTQTHNLFPEKFLLYTEACDGPFMSGGLAVQLGNWSRGENYARDMIQVSNNWVGGWVDWNFALNLLGGPTWANNYLDAAIIVNATADEFLKQPTYYAQLHFSRYVPPGSYGITLQREVDRCDSSSGSDSSDSSGSRKKSTGSGSDESSGDTDGDGTSRVSATAFVTPDDRVIIVFLNEDSAKRKVVVKFDGVKGGVQFKDTLFPRSIQTVIVRLK